MKNAEAALQLSTATELAPCSGPRRLKEPSPQIIRRGTLKMSDRISYAYMAKSKHKNQTWHRNNNLRKSANKIGKHTINCLPELLLEGITFTTGWDLPYCCINQWALQRSLESDLFYCVLPFSHTAFVFAFYLLWKWTSASRKWLQKCPPSCSPALTASRSPISWSLCQPTCCGERRLFLPFFSVFHSLLYPATIRKQKPQPQRQRLLLLFLTLTF